MAQVGWISLSRQLLDCFIWDDKPFNRGAAWVDLLLLANHEDKKVVIDGKIVIVGRGQRWTSYRVLAERWGWGMSKVKKFIEMLESDQMITIETFKNGTLLTIVNYAKFQDVRNANGTQTERKRNVSGTQTEREQNVSGTQTERNNNNNNINNVNNENNDNKDKRYFPNDDLLEKTFATFREHRKAIKYPMTDRAIDLMVKQINRMSPNEAVAAMERSIINGYRGIEWGNKNNTRQPQSLADKWGVTT